MGFAIRMREPKSFPSTADTELNWILWLSLLNYEQLKLIVLYDHGNILAGAVTSLASSSVRMLCLWWNNCSHSLMFLVPISPWAVFYSPYTRRKNTNSRTPSHSNSTTKPHCQREKARGKSNSQRAPGKCENMDPVSEGKPPLPYSQKINPPKKYIK